MAVLTPVLVGLNLVVSIALIAVTAVQTTKSERGSGGSMGWGIIGGKSQSSIHTRWGIEEHLNRITSVLAIAFLVTAALAAVAVMNR